MRSLVFTALLALPLALWAQAPPPAAEEDKDGTTVMGDRESPIGLLIAPWKEAPPEADIDRPARFLEEEMFPIDPDVYRRQLEYWGTITAHLRSRGVPGYAEPQPIPAAAASPPSGASLTPAAPPSQP